MGKGDRISELERQSSQMLHRLVTLEDLLKEHEDRIAALESRFEQAEDWYYGEYACNSALTKRRKEPAPAPPTLKGDVEMRLDLEEQGYTPGALPRSPGALLDLMRDLKQLIEGELVHPAPVPRVVEVDLDMDVDKHCPFYEGHDRCTLVGRLCDMGEAPDVCPLRQGPVLVRAKP